MLVVVFAVLITAAVFAIRYFTGGHHAAGSRKARGLRTCWPNASLAARLTKTTTGRA